MTVWIMAAVAFLVVLAVVMIPREQKHNGGACRGLWFQRRITVRGVAMENVPSVYKHEIAHHEGYHTEKLLGLYLVALVVFAVAANMTSHPVIVFLLLGVVANYGTGKMVKYFEKQANSSF